MKEEAWKNKGVLYGTIIIFGVIVIGKLLFYQTIGDAVKRFVGL